MKRSRMWPAVSAVLLCLLVGSCAPAAPPAAAGLPAPAGDAAAAPKVGDAAPAFSLQTVDGQNVSSASLANERKPYVLFFFATDRKSVV